MDSLSPGPSSVTKKGNSSSNGSLRLSGIIIVMRIVFALFAVLTVIQISEAADLVMPEGKKTAGKLVGFEGDVIVWDVGGGTNSKTPAKQVASIEFRSSSPTPKESKFDELELTDGSVLRLSKLAVKGKSVEPTLLTAEVGTTPTVQLPISSVSAFIRSADDAKAKADWRKLLQNRSKRDLFVIRQADGLNPLPGTVIEGNEAGDAVSFEREDGQRVNLKLARATGGLFFNQAPRDVIPPTFCKVQDVFGNSLVATKLTTTGSNLEVTTVSGAKLTYPSLDGLWKLDFSEGNITYLADLQPTIDYPPPEKDGVFGEQSPYAPKVALYNAPTMTLIKPRPSVSIPVDTTLTYKLDGNFREFRATPMLLAPTNADSWGLRLRIEVDGRKIYEEVVSSKTKPAELTFNVKDAREVRVMVEREGLFLGSRLLLGDARIQK
ncbi:MAG: hypothetical protein ACRC8S_16485 [Fimbriiglobus sp.]